MATWHQARVLHGEKTGRTIGFPTVNLDPSIIPDHTEKGIYASKVQFGDKEYQGVLYFGPRLVKNETNDVLEIHILDFNEEIYGDEILFTLEGFVRGVKNFASLEELKEAIKLDVEKAREILTND